MSISRYIYEKYDIGISLRFLYVCVRVIIGNEGRCQCWSFLYQL